MPTPRRAVTVSPVDRGQGEQPQRVARITSERQLVEQLVLEVLPATGRGRAPETIVLDEDQAPAGCAIDYSSLLHP
jgi:hypothetical protein